MRGDPGDENQGSEDTEKQTEDRTYEDSNGGSGIVSGSSEAVGAADQPDSIPAAAGGGNTTVLPGTDEIDPLATVNQQVHARDVAVYMGNVAFIQL